MAVQTGFVKRKGIHKECMDIAQRMLWSVLVHDRIVLNIHEHYETEFKYALRTELAGKGLLTF